MKSKYIKPIITVANLDVQPLMAASNPAGFTPEIKGDDSPITGPEDILSKRYSAWEE